MTSRASRRSTGSPASADGQWLLGLEGGGMTAQSGPPPAPANLTPPPAAASAPMIQGICGRTYFDCGEPQGPLSAWESRLRANLATVGSTESALIWREKRSPAGQSIFRLSRSTVLTNGTDSSGSPWPTPKASAAGETSRGGDRKDEPLIGGLMREAHSASTRSTPRASDGEKGAPLQQFSGGGTPLPAQIYGASASPRVTPSARDWKDSPGMATEAEGGRKRVDQLPRQMVSVSAWPTPTSLSFKDSHQPGNSRNITLMMDLARTALSGATPSGSSAPIKKSGAPNPEFAFWLMGYPDELISGVSRAMALFSRSRRRSSGRSAKQSTRGK